MASKDVMEVAQSPPLSWEDWVQEEEDKQERHSFTEGDSQPCPSSPQLEGCNISNVSMADEGPQQHDSDVVVEEEESMETDEPIDSGSPALLPEKAFLEGHKAEAEAEADKGPPQPYVRRKYRPEPTP